MKKKLKKLELIADCHINNGVLKTLSRLLNYFNYFPKKSFSGNSLKRMIIQKAKK